MCVQSSGLKVQAVGFRIFSCRLSGLGFRVEVLGSVVCGSGLGLGFGVEGLGCRVQGLMLRE